uniref:Uncharacterized protein n=1 Tax=uncultured prokaryote TaxID=198431 RepID=A0A0H5Q3R7_9ZZZZ|nr:hypothetical protein [uncultured prokaryote]
MPFTRWIINCKRTEATPATDAVVNTLYFNITDPGGGVDYNALGNDLWTLWAARPWATGRFLDVRGYDMGDAEPRPQKFIKRAAVAGTIASSGAPQVALALSYYADRNLPRQRGRIFIGPWMPADTSASTAQVNQVMALPPLLAGLGGVNVDWSLWSPTTQEHTRINHAWCDNSWDIIRSRKLSSTAVRSTWSGDG